MFLWFSTPIIKLIYSLSSHLSLHKQRNSTSLSSLGLISPFSLLSNIFPFLSLTSSTFSSFFVSSSVPLLWLSHCAPTHCLSLLITLAEMFSFAALFHRSQLPSPPPPSWDAAHKHLLGPLRRVSHIINASLSRMVQSNDTFHVLVRRWLLTNQRLLSVWIALQFNKIRILYWSNYSSSALLQ